MNPLFLIIIIILFGGMMFFTSRQQKKQQQQRQEQLNTMQPGSEIVTIGGLHGVLSSVDEAKGTIDLDCEGVILTFDRAAVKTVKSATAQTAPAATVEAPSAEATEVEAEKIDNPIEEK